MPEEILSFKREVSPIGPSPVFDIFGFPIADSTLFILVIILIILAFNFFVLKDSEKKIVPGNVQAFFELVYEAISKQIRSVTKNDYHTSRVLPIIASIFIFVGFSNYLGLLPGLGSITWNGAPVFRQATADFNTTFGLAFGALIVFQFVILKDFGILGFIGKYIPIKQIKQDMKKGVLSPIYVFVTILIACLDIVGELAKTFSVSLRLFGNMYAGMVLTTVLISLFAFVLPAFWVAFGLLGALIQTLVFGLLITVYYMQVAGPEPGTEVEKS